MKTFKEWSILANMETINLLEEDYEFSMARGQLRTAQSAITRLMAKLKGEGDLEAWVQSKITKAADYLDTVADQLYYGEDDTKRKEEEVKESFSPHEEAMRRSSEKLKKEKKITTAPMVMPRNAVYRPKEDPIKDTSVKEQPKPKAEEKKEPLTALQAAKLRKLERDQNKKQKRRKSVKESLELHDASGNTFAHVVDIIDASNYKFKSLTQPITEDAAAVLELEDELKKLDNTSYDSIDKLMRSIMKEHDITAKELHNAFVKKHDKTPDDWIKGLNEKCWDGYKQVGMKKKGKRAVPNCVPEEVELDEVAPSGAKYERMIKYIKKNYAKDGDLTDKEKSIAYATAWKAKNMEESTILEKCWKGYKKKGMKTMFGKRYPNCVKEEGLRDWFGKSKSKDGKSGWVNVVTGGTCASDEPGEGTPKCVSSAKRASMSDAERKSAARRKKAADPGQQSKSGAAKPTYVSTDSPKKKMNENHKAIADGEERDEEGYMANTQMDTIISAVRKLKKTIKSGDTQLPAWVQSKITKAADYIDTVADYMDSNEVSEVSEEADKKTKGSGTKDACYTKVKSRYSVWPSAYASGALVKCRKVGAANWGNKSESIDLKSKDPLTEAQGMIRFCPKCKKNETKDECRYGSKYWDMFSVPTSLSNDAYDANDNHPTNEGASFEIGAGHKKVNRDAKIRNLATGNKNPNEKEAALGKLKGPSLPLADSIIHPGQLTTEDYQRIQSTGNVYTILFSWRGRPMMNLQLFFPNMKRPSKQEVTSQVEKLYPGAVVFQWRPSVTDPTKPIIVIQN
jgi:hypothetical protein